MWPLTRSTTPGEGRGLLSQPPWDLTPGTHPSSLTVSPLGEQARSGVSLLNVSRALCPLALLAPAPSSIVPGGIWFHWDLWFQLCHQSPFLSHRWLCYCHVPQSCDSLPRYETTHVFGRSLLKSIFTVTRRQLLEKFRVEKDKLVPEKRTLILTHFPK